LMYSLDVSFTSDLPHMWLRWVVIVMGTRGDWCACPAFIPRIQVALPRITYPAWSSLLPAAPPLFDAWWTSLIVMHYGGEPVSRRFLLPPMSLCVRKHCVSHCINHYRSSMMYRWFYLNS
jgi:hypothetical protein